MSLVPLRPLYAKLHDACVDDPGIVLADNNMGHYIRYYSDCAVIANNFLLTPQHFRKIEDIHRYLSMSASELLANAPQVKYVIVRPAEVGAKDGQIRYRFYFQGNSRLANDLLFDAPDRVPPEFKLLEEIRFKEAGNVPYAKLYKIERAAPSGNNANK